MRVIAAKAGDDDLAPVGAAVAIGVLQEEDVRRVGHPHATGADGDARRDIQIVGKDGKAVGPAVVVGVFENLDPVPAGPRLLARVFQAFGNPHPATLVKGHGHRVDDVGLGRHQFDLKALGHCHFRDRFGRRYAGPGARC